jgi:CSLREA domain-containing protein
VLDVVHIHARSSSALAWADARASSTLATITVNSTADVAADDGQCTLREAIIAANTDTASGGALGECSAGLGDDTIDLTGITGAIDLSGALPSIASGIALNGPGANNLAVRRNNGGNYRILTVEADVTVRISGLTICNGLAIGAGAGGGIYNAGTLMVNHCVIADNEAVGEGPFAGVGGGIYNLGTLGLAHSTVSGNTASDYGGGIYNGGSGSTVVLTATAVISNSAMHGGGVFSDGTVELENSTISDNKAVQVGDYGGTGGGIRNSGGIVELTSSTVSCNSAAVAGGGIYSLGTMRMINTIVADQVSGADCAGDAITSNGYNLDSDGSCGLDAPGDRTADPQLAPLRDNGGPTETRALSFGSPAIDAIPVESCTDRLGTPIAVDQRGVPRPQGAACDIGAYEVIKNVLYLPLVLDNYLPLAVFPLHIGDAIPVRPVAYQGEVFYTTSIQVPGQLPPDGHFYFSSQQSAVAAALVDDAMAVLLDGSEVFAYDFSPGGTPEPAIVELPRATMEQLAGETVTVEYRDVYGSVVEASAMWLVWTP